MQLPRNDCLQRILARIFVSAAQGERHSAYQLLKERGSIYTKNVGRGQGSQQRESSLCPHLLYKIAPTGKTSR